jgi:hypothetical protein
VPPAGPAFNADSLRRQPKIDLDLEMFEADLKATLEAAKESAAAQG